MKQKNISASVAHKLTESGDHIISLLNNGEISDNFLAVLKRLKYLAINAGRRGILVPPSNQAIDVVIEKFQFSVINDVNLELSEKEIEDLRKWNFSLKDMLSRARSEKLLAVLDDMIVLTKLESENV